MSRRLAGALAIATFVLVAALTGSPRAAFALAGLALPGIAIDVMLFGGRDRRPEERLLFAACLSLAVLALLGLALHFAWRIDVTGWAVGIAVLTLAAVPRAIRNQRVATRMHAAATRATRSSDSATRGEGVSGRLRLGQIALGVLALTLTIFAVALSRHGEQDRVDRAQIIQLWLTRSAGGDLQVGYNSSQPLRLEVTRGSRTLLSASVAPADNGQSRRLPRPTGEGAVVARLFVTEGAGPAIRTVKYWPPRQ